MNTAYGIVAAAEGRSLRNFVQLSALKITITQPCLVRNSECQGDRKMMKCVPSFFSRIFKNRQSIGEKKKKVVKV